MADHLECPNCGNDLSINEQYCKYCGTPNPSFEPVEIIKYPNSQKNQTQEPLNLKKPQKKASKAVTVLIYAGVFSLFVFPPLGVALIIIAVLISFNQQYGKKKN